MAKLDAKGGVIGMVNLDEVPHGECVDCGAKTYLWCDEVANWHCTSCDDRCD